MRKQVWWSVEDALNETKEAEKDYFYSVGYLFKETKRYYYISGSIHIENDKLVSFGEIFSIPKGCVIKKQNI